MDVSTENSISSILHSVDATNTVYVQFLNGTQRFVDVIWIDYIGQWIRYETLSPGDSYDVYTYVTHPWVFLDGDTGIRLHAAGRGKVFYPLMSDCQEEVNMDGTAQLSPVQIIVSVPVFTLKQRCLEVMCLSVNDRDNFSHLNLPRELVLDLQTTYDTPGQYRVLDSAQMEAEEEFQEADDEGFNETAEEIVSEDLNVAQGSAGFDPFMFQTNESVTFNEAMVSEAVASVMERLHLSLSTVTPDSAMTSSIHVTSGTSSGTIASSQSLPPHTLPRLKFNNDQTSTTDDDAVVVDADDEDDSSDNRREFKGHP